MTTLTPTAPPVLAALDDVDRLRAAHGPDVLHHVIGVLCARHPDDVIEAVAKAREMWGDT